MRIKPTTSLDSMPAAGGDDGFLPETESPVARNLLTDGFDAKGAAKPKLPTPVTKTGTTSTTEPKLVKVDGMTPTYVSTPGTLFDGKTPGADDIDQGEVGDCFYLSTLASLAQRDPSAIKNMIKDNGDGTYTMQFYKKTTGGQTQPVSVTVDGTIPELQDKSGANVPVYASSPDSNEKWVEIAEKAYAKFVGGYTTADQGGMETDAMTALTGKPAAAYPVNPQNSSALYDALKQAASEGKLTTAGTFDNADLKSNLTTLQKQGVGTIAPTTTYAKLGLVDDHAYTITGVTTVNGQQMVQMRNPWGTQGYQGQGQSNGDFSIPLKDFAQLFQEVSIGG